MSLAENILVQEVTVNYLFNELDWGESIFGMYEKLIELNPNLPQKAYARSLKKIITERKQ